MIDDQVPQEGAPEELQPPQAPPEPEAPPQIDLNAAIEAVSQHYGWDPRVADYEIREFGQRKSQLERKEREIAALEERARRSASFEAPPGYEQDPTFRTVAELAREMREDREERRREREYQAQTAQLGQDLDTGYNSLMARVSTKVDRDKFFHTMLEVYPDQELLTKVGIDRAMNIVYRLATSNQPPSYSNGGMQTRPTRRDAIVVPTQGGTSANTTPPSNGLDLTQHEGETPEQTFSRIVRRAQELGISIVPPDGTRLSSG